MNIVAITVAGVLHRPSDDAILQHGRLLYQSLQQVCPVALLTDNVEATKRWVSLQGLNEPAYLLEARTGLSGVDARREQLQRLREAQHVVSLVIEPDPIIAADLYSDGMPVMLTLHPHYSQPSHRPDFRGEVTPWSILVKKVDKLNQLANNDTRMAEIL